MSLAGGAASFSTMESLFRTMALRPELAQHSRNLLEAAMRTGSVEPALKELLAVRVSQVNHCHYWMAAHTALAGQLGVSEELLDALYHIDRFRHLFSERQLVALRFAEIMTTDAREVDEALWDNLQAHFDDGEIVELATVIGLFNFFNRFADALQLT
jgi:uncharacterized peroxidase-related enzyme